MLLASIRLSTITSTINKLSHDVIELLRQHYDLQDTSMARSILVSNQDAQIHYKGEWFLVNSSIFQNLGDFGPPLEGIYHATTSNSSFSFSFSGDFIVVLALMTDSPPNGPEVECFVDGVNASSSFIQTGLNNDPQFAMFLPDGPHELVLNVFTRGWPYYLDSIRYVPSANVSTNNAVVLIDNTDPSVTFSPQWSQSGSFAANSTGATNAFVNISFIGIQIEWIGIILGSRPHAPSPAEYSVDDGPLIPFTLAGLPSNVSNSTDLVDVPFFTTGVLQQEPHTLFVRFLGNESTTPLTLYCLLVTNASDPATTASSSRPISTPSASSTPPSTPQSDDKRGVPNGAIGGFVLVGFGAVVALLYVYYRRSKRKKLRVRQGPRTRFQLGLSSASGVSFSSATGEHRELRGDLTTQETAATTPPVSTSIWSDSSVHQMPSSVATLHTTAFAQSSGFRGLSGSESPPSYSSLGPTAEQEQAIRRVLVHHEDSGLRMITPSLSNALLVEIPPGYSPS